MAEFEDPKPDLKRKRQSSDEGAMRPTGFARSDGNAGPHDDNSAASFLAQSDEGLPQGPGGLDMSGLPHSGANNSNASDTAAAALSHAYMSVPQSTELSFTANGGDSPDVRRERFDDHIRSQLTGANVGQPQSPPSAGGNSGSKPPVGSDEWHRQRRDNHKEGKSSVI
jgi:transcriptional regulator CBF1